jgi:hypothetical protein
MSRWPNDAADDRASADWPLQFNSEIPLHWPPWARLVDRQVGQVLELTVDDLDFLDSGFGETLPLLTHDPEDLNDFENWRFQRFCLTFDGYFWVGNEYPHSGVNPVVVLAAVHRRVRLIAGGDLGGDTKRTPVADDAWMRLATACSFPEIRACMFNCQRAYHHWFSGPGPTFLESYPELHQMSRALRMMLRNGKRLFWDEPLDDDNA